MLLTCKWHRRSTDECVETVRRNVYLGPESSELPSGVETRPGGYPDEVMFWVQSCNALVVGDVILGPTTAFASNRTPGMFEGQTRESLRDSLRPLLELPIEVVPVAHGDPGARGTGAGRCERARDLDGRAVAGLAPAGPPSTRSGTTWGRLRSRPTTGSRPDRPNRPAARPRGARRTWLLTVF